MPLSNNQYFNVKALTEAVKRLPDNPTKIRQLGVFTPAYLTTTYVNVEQKQQHLGLVQAVPRGVAGEGVRETRTAPKTFHAIHLPINDQILADDVQNLRAFGSDNSVVAVADLVNDKLQLAKDTLGFSREYLMFCALKGEIKNKDKSKIYNIYDEFGLKRKTHTLNLADDINPQLDDVIVAQSKTLNGEPHNGSIALCSAGFLKNLSYHDSMKEIYLRYQTAVRYTQGEVAFAFEHKGISFLLYDYEFENGEKLADDEAIWLPKGTRNVFREFFAPADMNATVNTKAEQIYVSREKLPHDRGWSLRVQTNVLPMVLKPEAVATLKIKK